jgi:hypothetical protein
VMLGGGFRSTVKGQKSSRARAPSLPPGLPPLIGHFGQADAHIKHTY